MYGSTEAVRGDDDQNKNNETIFPLSDFFHKIFKFRKVFLDYLDNYTD